jgi:hypothetical protein
MIACAEAACERYRQVAEQRGLPPPIARKRLAASQQAVGLLARLRAQRLRAEQALGPERLVR